MRKFTLLFFSILLLFIFLGSGAVSAGIDFDVGQKIECLKGNTMAYPQGKIISSTKGVNCSILDQHPRMFDSQTLILGKYITDEGRPFSGLAPENGTVLKCPTLSK